MDGNLQECKGCRFADWNGAVNDEWRRNPRINANEREGPCSVRAAKTLKSMKIASRPMKGPGEGRACRVRCDAERDEKIWARRLGGPLLGQAVFLPVGKSTIPGARCLQIPAETQRVSDRLHKMNRISGGCGFQPRVRGRGARLSRPQKNHLSRSSPSSRKFGTWKGIGPLFADIEKLQAAKDTKNFPWREEDAEKFPTRFAGGSRWSGQPSFFPAPPGSSACS